MTNTSNETNYLINQLVPDTNTKNNNNKLTKIRKMLFNHNQFR